jgi:hypothetical protein
VKESQSPSRCPTTSIVPRSLFQVACSASGREDVSGGPCPPSVWKEGVATQSGSRAMLSRNTASGVPRLFRGFALAVRQWAGSLGNPMHRVSMPRAYGVRIEPLAVVLISWRRLVWVSSPLM